MNKTWKFWWNAFAQDAWIMKMLLIPEFWDIYGNWNWYIKSQRPEQWMQIEMENFYWDFYLKEIPFYGFNPRKFCSWKMCGNNLLCWTYYKWWWNIINALYIRHEITLAALCWEIMGRLVILLLSKWSEEVIIG